MITRLMDWIAGLFRRVTPTPTPVVQPVQPPIPVPAVLTPPPKPAPPPKVPDDPRSIPHVLLAMHNLRRDQARVPQLTLSPLLCDCAAAHCTRMAHTYQSLANASQPLENAVLHQLPGEEATGERIARSGYPARAWAENIAGGQKTTAEVMDAWMKSDGHRKNILRKDVSDVGFSVSDSSDGTLFWTAVFAYPTTGSESQERLRFFTLSGPMTPYTEITPKTAPESAS